MLVVSFAKVSIARESVPAVSTEVIEVSVAVESVASPVFSELQAATDKDIARAKKPNLNAFFIMIFYLLINFHELIL